MEKVQLLQNVFLRPSALLQIQLVKTGQKRKVKKLVFHSLNYFKPIFLSKVFQPALKRKYFSPKYWYILFLRTMTKSFFFACLVFKNTYFEKHRTS